MKRLFTVILTVMLICTSTLTFNTVKAEDYEEDTASSSETISKVAEIEDNEEDSDYFSDTPVDVTETTGNEEDPDDFSDAAEDVIETFDYEETEEEISIPEQGQISEEENEDVFSFGEEETISEELTDDIELNSENSTVTTTIYWGLESNDTDTYELHLSSISFTETMAYSGTTDGVFGWGNGRPWNSYKTAITEVSIDNSIVPSKTAYWFYGLENATSRQCKLICVSQVKAYGLADEHRFLFCLNDILKEEKELCKIWQR